MTTLLLKLLGAVAGLAALTTFAGGAVLWVRFDHLGLPADQVLTLLPKQLLLTVGARELLLPVTIGALLGAVLVALAPLRTGRHRRLFWVVVGVVALAIAVTLAVVLGGTGSPGWLAIVGLAAATILTIGAIVAVAGFIPDRSEPLVWTLATGVALISIVLAVARTATAPAMEPVALLLDGRPETAVGFYVGQTSDRIYLAPLPGNGAADDPFADQPLDRVLELHRERVRQLVLRAPVATDGDGPGRDESRTLLADLRLAEAARPVAPVATKRPVATFAPLVNLHARERAWPMSADFFLAHAWLTWAAPRCPLWIQGAADGEGASGDVTRHRELLGAFDVERLAGKDAYRRARVDTDCDEGPGAKIPASAHTRPWDRGRPAGLPLREGWALDLENDARAPRPALVRDGPQQVLQRVPIYFERHREDGGLRITYWFFYGLSHPPGAPSFTEVASHEGDWERISVLLQHASGSAVYVPLSVRFHTHDGYRDVAWRSVARIAADNSPGETHPVVYSALGSHATYWRTGEYTIVVPAIGRPAFSVKDRAMACSGCPQWRTWDRLIEATRQPWYGFGGAWGRAGNVKNGGTTGPLGPSRYKTAGASPSPTRTLYQARTPVRETPAPAAR